MDVATYSTDFLAFAADLHMPLPGGPAALGPRMADFQRRDFAALAPTLHALAAGSMPPVRRYWIERTKGAAKDSDCTVALLWLLAFARRSVRVQVIADDQQQASEIRLIVEQVLAIDAPLNRLLRAVIEVQRATVRSDRNGSTIEILTRDDRGSHGARPDLVLVNELSHIGDEGFASTVMDNLDKVPTAVGIVATNAGFVDSWQYRWRSIAESSPDRWYFATVARPAPWVSEADLAESRRRNSAGRYARLWEGQWVRGSGDALDHADIRRAVVLGGPTLAPVRGVDYFIGLDLSTKRDHSAAVLLGADAVGQVVRVGQVLSWSPADNGGTVPLMEVRDTVGRLARQFSASLVYDPHQAALLVQELSKAGVWCVEVPFSAANLSLMAQTLLQAFRERRLELFDDARLLADLGKLSIEERGGFGYKLTAAADRETGHADRAFALAICLPAAVEALRQGGIIDCTGQQPIEIEGFFGAPLDARPLPDDRFRDLRGINPLRL